MKTLFEELTEAGIECDHHESDLYIPDTEESRKVLSDRLLNCIRAASFQSKGMPWIEVPFAYDPFWGGK